MFEQWRPFLILELKISYLCFLTQTQLKGLLGSVGKHLTRNGAMVSLNPIKVFHGFIEQRKFDYHSLVPVGFSNGFEFDSHQQNCLFRI